MTTSRDYQRYARRGTTTQRGLGSSHQRDVKRARAALKDGEPCWRCGYPMYRWQKLDLDHLVNRIDGGADGPTRLAHASCNRRAGQQITTAILRSRNQQWRQARMW